VQFEPTLFDKEGNIARLIDLVAQAARAGVRLIVTPEMGISGYCMFDETEALSVAETVPGPATDRFSGLAAEHDCYIVIGMPELEESTGLLYNSAVLVGPQGVVGVHRKTHGYISEPKWAAPGNNGHQVFETPIGTIAMLICMDLHYIETARLVALQGAASFATSAIGWPNARRLPTGCPAPSRTAAILWKATGGDSSVVSSSAAAAASSTPMGRLRRPLTRVTVSPLPQSISTSPGVCDRLLIPPLTLRRPHHYRQLQRDSYLWNPLDFFTLYDHHPLPAASDSVLAVAQRSPGTSFEENRDTVADEFTDAVTNHGADLVVFPDLALSGTNSDGSHVRLTTAALTEDLRPLLEHTARLQAWMVAGFTELDEPTGAVHRSALVLGPDGVAAVHRSLHETTDSGYAEGDSWTVVDTPMGRLGILCGTDVALSESTRVLALMGCDIVAVCADTSERWISAHPGTRVDHSYPIPTGASTTHWHHMRVRAGENNVFLAYANTSGGSGVFGPDTFAFPRTESVLGAEQGLATLAIDLTNADCPYPTSVVRRKDLVTMRLPHWYRSLSGPHT